MNNKSPLRYPGGKTRACKVLDKIINKYFPIDTMTNIVSPFFGGGSFEFFIQNKYNLTIIANDKFTPLYNFWNICKVKQTALCDMLYTSKEITKEIFTEIRKNIMSETNELTQAFYYFIINRCSFSGATLSGGFSPQASKKRFTTSSIDRIKKLDLSKVTIQNEDFTTFLTSVNIRNSGNSLIFLDPPYYLQKGSKLYGKNGDMHINFNHKELFDIISTKTNWLLTYNDCEYIRQLYKDFTIIDTQWSYGMNKTKKSSEIIIINVKKTNNKII